MVRGFDCGSSNHSCCTLFTQRMKGNFLSQLCHVDRAMKTAILLVSFFLSCEALLEKRDIDAKYAFCNDGSNAVMYVDDRHRTKWVIYFEGGGGCKDISHCITRSEDVNTRVLTSSLDLKFLAVEGEDILSSEPDRNKYFHNYRHVLVPYCSSDYWLGNVSREEYSGRNFSFLGEVIMKAAVQNLMGDGLLNATEVVLYGVSAAAVGLLNHLKWIHNQLPGVNLSLILDSGLFVNHNNVYQYLYSKEMSDNMLSSYPLCQQTDEFGIPCCLLPACLLLNGDSAAIPLVRMLFISSMYDSYLLKFALQLAISSLGPRDDAAFLMTRSINEVYSYGSSLLSHATLLHFSLPQISFIMPSCTQHIFVVSSDLWNEGGPLKKAFNRSAVLDFAVVNNDIQAGLWDSITIHGTTIQDHIRIWHNTTNESIFITDSCKELFCSVGCQEFVKLASEDFSINMWWEWLIFSFALLLVYGPLCPKLILLAQQKWLFRLQKRYVRVKTSQKLNKQGCLFTSISCNGLTYRVHRDLTCMFKGKRLLSSLAQCNGCNRMSSNASVEDINSSDETGILPSVPSHGSSSGLSGEKHIIHDVNLYINPGELVAIMGPTGSGKTTLLDVLLGHRAGGITEGNVFVLGIPLNAMKKWFQSNSGYVRQLVIPYYEELTVRENLVLSANMQLPPGTTFEQLLERVEQVIEETNLRSVADFMVGGSSGVGLSGGQKKRLCIALQLVKLPSVIFLDEPTSGLDASASKELLTILNSLSQGGRSVLLTIHQPRIEIFHMFHKVVLLSEGQITYFGSPFNALSYFNKTLVENSIPVKLNDAVSPADALLDILTHKANQSVLVNAYRKSGEDRAVEKAVLLARQSYANAPTATHVQNPGFWRRLMSFESRASLRQTWIQVVYIPVVFIIVAILISTAYHPADVGTKIAAVVCLTSCCSSLLMSSMVMGLLIKPLQIFALEYSDGISKPQDLILHVFIRMAAISALPLTLCMTIIALVVYQPLNPVTVVFVIVVFLLVNLCWINIFILITSSFPRIAHRISPLVAALGSFFCGFIIPRDEVGLYYRWILYIDPSYYAFSATSVAVFRSWRFCQNDHVECFAESSVAYISLFDLDDVVPIYHVVILIAFIIILLLLSMLVLKLRVEYASIQRAMYTVKNALQRKTTKSSGNSQVGPTDPEESDPGVSDADNRRTKHRVLHTFTSWGAVDHDCSSEGQRAEHQHNAELAPDDVSEDHYEMIDLQQSSRQQRLFEAMLKRKVRMEQAVLSVNQGMGDWLCADSESNLLMQEAVGYTAPTEKRSAVSDKQNSWSHLTNNSKNSPQFPRERSFLINSEDYGFVLPGGTDSDEDSTIF